MRRTLGFKMLNDQRNPLVFFILILAITAADSEREREKKKQGLFFGTDFPGKMYYEGKLLLNINTDQESSSLGL